MWLTATALHSKLVKGPLILYKSLVYNQRESSAQLGKGHSLFFGWMVCDKQAAHVGKKFTPYPTPYTKVSFRDIAFLNAKG